MNPRPPSAYKPVWILFAIIVAVTVITAVSKVSSRGEDKIPWRTDPAAAAEEAKRDGKPVMLYFTASWCGPCQRMKGETWSDAAVAAKLTNFVPVKIDIDANGGFAQGYAIDGIPALVVLDKSGNVARQVSGYMTAAELTEWIDG